VKDESRDTAIMHFALPPRKSSFPPPYARVNSKNSVDQRRKQIQYLGYLVFGILTLYLVVKTFSAEAVPEQNALVDKDASVLIVTVLDEATMSKEYISMIKTTRDDYAARHGEHSDDIDAL